MTQDAQGNAVSGGTRESVERLDQAIRAFTIGHGDALALLDAAGALSPDMPMALLGVKGSRRKRPGAGLAGCHLNLSRRSAR